MKDEVLLVAASLLAGSVRDGRDYERSVVHVPTKEAQMAAVSIAFELQRTVYEEIVRRESAMKVEFGQHGYYARKNKQLRGAR